MDHGIDKEVLHLKSFHIMYWPILFFAVIQCYMKTEKWLLEWEYRKKNLLKEILHYDADVSYPHQYSPSPFTTGIPTAYL